MLADDHEIVRKGIKMLLESESDIEVVAEASDGQEAIDLLGSNHPDIVIMDIRMPNLNGIEATKTIKDKFPAVSVLVLSMHDDEEYITQSIDCGADGYLLKDSGKEEFVKAIHNVYGGQKYFSADISNILVNNYLSAKKSGAVQVDTEPAQTIDYGLTKRERQILKMIYEGVSNKDIADQLQKSIRTIETHRFNIMKKLEVSNIAELLRKIENEPGLKNGLK